MQTAYISISLAGKRQHANLPLTAAILQKVFGIIENIMLRHKPALLIKLVTGLADGADTDAADAFLQWKQDARTAKILQAAIPFPKQDYLQTISDRPRFERLYNACNNIVILDGHYVPDGAGTTGGITPAECRSRGYRQQAAYLLTACDLLITVAAPEEEGKAGGTLETMDKAFEKRLPVILLSLTDLNLYLFTSKNDTVNYTPANQLTAPGNLQLLENVLNNIAGA